jgi:histidinol phosphatase-like PHP family hydrolase
MEIKFPKLNLHIHSTYSDGRNSLEQIVNEALRVNLDIICITDHLTDSWKADHIPNLNNLNKIQRYLEEITYLKESIFNQNKSLTLLKGVEIDLSSTEKYIINNISPNAFDLILFEYLETLEGIAFVKKILDHWISKKKSNFPIIGLAHFDPSFFLIKGLDILLDFLKKYDIVVEFNSSYSQFYSPKYEIFYKKLQESGIKVSIGSDAHHISTLNDVEEPYSMIKFYNLEENLKVLIASLENKRNTYST